MQTAKATSTGDVVSTGGTVRGLHFIEGGVGGQIVLKDGSDGETRLDMDTAGHNEGDDVTIPYPGLHFENAIHVDTMQDVSSLTVFYIE